MNPFWHIVLIVVVFILALIVLVAWSDVGEG